MPEPQDHHRFFMPKITVGDNALPADQADHARRVLRLDWGRDVLVFDGQGHSATGPLRPAGRGAHVRVESVSFSPPPAVRLTVACAVPKADRADQCVEMLSQLNVYALQWTLYDRAVVRPSAEGNKMEKWRRLAVESCKQCGRLWSMRVLPPTPLEHLLSTVAGVGPAPAPASPTLLVYGAPDVPCGLGQFMAPAAPAMANATSDCTLDIAAFVGPEGGFSPRERALLQNAGVSAVRLAPTVLRIETAAVAFAAVVAAAIPHARHEIPKAEAR